MTIRKTPIRLSGNRESLFMGGDREIIMFSGVLSGTLVFAAPGIKTFILGATLWLFSLMVCRLMAKSDPKMRSVYLRHRKYNPYYPARSRPFRVNISSWRDY